MSYRGPSGFKRLRKSWKVEMVCGAEEVQKAKELSGAEVSKAVRPHEEGQSSIG